MIYSSNIKEYINNIMTNVVPISDLARMPVNPSGLVNLTKDISLQWPIELPNSVEAGLYRHEKSSTTRYGILANRDINTLNPVFHSHYFKPFSGGMKSANNLIAQSILELYPTPIQTYGAVLENSTISGGVIDLNHLVTKHEHLPVESIRLDMFLNSLGLDKEINSFADLQRLIKLEYTSKFLSERAIVQLALCSYFLPNAVGEVDANSRNIILLKDPRTGKFEYVTRIDAESNTYFNDLNNERSGKKMLPKGIFHGNEYFDTEFLKAIGDKDQRIDWDLFASFTFLADKIASTNNIDNAIFSGYRRNYARVPYDKVRPNSMADNYFGIDAYGSFSQSTIERAKRYHAKVFSALGFNYSTHLPFEDMKVAEPSELKMQLFDHTGRPLTVKETEEIEREL